MFAPTNVRFGSVRQWAAADFISRQIKTAKAKGCHTVTLLPTGAVQIADLRHAAQMHDLECRQTGDYTLTIAVRRS